MHRDPIMPLIAARMRCEAMLASSKTSWRKRVAAAFTRGRLERRLLRRRPITNEGVLASLELILLTLKSYPDKDQGLQLISSLAVGVHSQFQRRDASRTPKPSHNTTGKAPARGPFSLRAGKSRASAQKNGASFRGSAPYPSKSNERVHIKYHSNLLHVGHRQPIAKRRSRCLIRQEVVGAVGLEPTTRRL